MRQIAPLAAASPVHKVLAKSLGNPIFPPYYPCEDDCVQTYLNRKDVMVSVDSDRRPLSMPTRTLVTNGLTAPLALTTTTPTSLHLLCPCMRVSRRKATSEPSCTLVMWMRSFLTLVPVSGLPTSVGRPRSHGAPGPTPADRFVAISLQVGGYIQVLDGLTFSTVRGAGHMVPEWQPDRAYGIALRNF